MKPRDPGLSVDSSSSVIRVSSHEGIMPSSRRTVWGRWNDDWSQHKLTYKCRNMRGFKWALVRSKHLFVWYIDHSRCAHAVPTWDLESPDHRLYWLRSPTLMKIRMLSSGKPFGGSVFLNFLALRRWWFSFIPSLPNISWGVWLDVFIYRLRRIIPSNLAQNGLCRRK